MRKILLVGWMLLLVGVAASEVRAEFALGDEDRVAFFGNKIAWAPDMPMGVETYIRVRYPQLQVRLRSYGWQAAGIVTGAIERFEQQVVASNPTVVVLCFGTDDVPRGPYREEHCGRFGLDFAKLVERVGQTGARVYVMTPLCPEVAGRKQLEDISYNETVATYAEVMRTVADQKGAVVIDWFAASKQYIEQHADNKRLAITVKGTMPSTLGYAVGMAAILDAWAAEPLDITIEADWDSESASASVGQAAVSKANDGDKIQLKLSGMPIPWVIPERGGVTDENWPVAKYFSFVLRVANVPNGGIMISEPGGKNAMPYLSEQLRQGADMCFVGPLVKLGAVSNLADWMRAKYKWDREHQKWMRKPLPEPEYEQAYNTYSLGFAQYLEATNLVVLRQPRTVDATLELFKAQPPPGFRKDKGGGGSATPAKASKAKARTKIKSKEKSGDE